MSAQLDPGYQQRQADRLKAYDDAMAANDRTAHLEPAAIANCTLCDGEGYRSGRVCDHVDRTAITRRGIAACRAALSKLPKS